MARSLLRVDSHASCISTARRGRSLPESARAWGVMPASEYVAAVSEAFARDYAPRFAALGISMPESSAGAR